MSATIGRLCRTSPSDDTRTSRIFNASLSERQLGVGLGGQDHARELALDAVERGRILALETQHDDGRRVRAARQAEAVRVFDAQAVDVDNAVRAREFGFGTQLV